MKIPLAEHFHSIMGEGTYVGTPMHFIRLPGCSVGRPIPPGVKGFTEPPELPSGKLAWLCHRFDGQPFWCDTDFNKYTEIELDDLLAETWESHICLTGGEPLMHKEIVQAIVEATTGIDIRLHIETSGTIDFPWIAIEHPEVWITVSPKQGYLDTAVMNADEIKLLVDQIPYTIPQAILDHPNVWVSPINNVGAEQISKLNLELALKTLKAHPSWRLSVQLHKYLGLR